MVDPPAGLGQDIKKIQVVLSDRTFYVKTSINHVAMGIPVLLLQAYSVGRCIIICLSVRRCDQRHDNR